MTAPIAIPRREWWRPELPAPVEYAPARSERSVVAFRALLVFIFVLLISPQSFVPAVGALHLAAVAAAVAITAHVVTALKQGRRLVGAHSAMAWAFALAVWALFTAPFSYWPGGTVSLLLDLYFKSLTIYWLIGAIVDTGERLRQLIAWLSVLTIPISTTALLHFVNGVYVEGGDPSAPRIIGYDAPLTANPNDLALVLCMMLPLAGALALGVRGRFARLLFAAIALLDVAAIVITYSRTGFLTLGALAAMGVAKLFRGHARPWALAIAALALGLLALLPDGYLQHMGTITAIDTDPTHSAQDRWSDSLIAANFVLAHPIVGAGAGMSTLALNEVRGPAWHPVHNVYLEYATDLGLPGLVLFLVLLGACLYKVTRVIGAMRRADAPADLRFIAHGVQMMLVAFVVAGFFHPVAYHFHFYYAGGLAAALAVVWEKEHV